MYYDVYHGECSWHPEFWTPPFFLKKIKGCVFSCSILSLGMGCVGDWLVFQNGQSKWQSRLAKTAFPTVNHQALPNLCLTSPWKQLHLILSNHGMQLVLKHAPNLTDQGTNPASSVGSKTTIRFNIYLVVRFWNLSKISFHQTSVFWTQPKKKKCIPAC